MRFDGYLPPPSYDLHPKDPLEVDTVTFGCCIAGVTIIMFGFLKNIQSKIMVVEAFVLFFPVASELNGGSKTIAVLVDRHTEQILMRIFLAV